MTKSRPKYTTTSGLSATFLWRICRITVNLTTFRTISGIFETISGFWILLPVHIFRYFAPSFLIGSMSSRISAIRQPYGPENGKKERSGAVEAKPEVEIWRRPDFFTRRRRLPIRPPIRQSVYLAPLRSFSELRPKVGQSTQLIPVWSGRLFCQPLSG